MSVLQGFVIVSGPPGAGKTTIAVPLAERLGLPLFCKDILKESLADHIPGPVESREWSRTLGGAAMELIWSLAARAPAAVLEANFRPGSAYERQRLSDLPGPVVEIYCRCPPVLAAERYRLRHGAGARHPIHVQAEVTMKMLREFDRPMNLGWVIEADTTGEVGIDSLAGRVRDALTAAG